MTTLAATFRPVYVLFDGLFRRVECGLGLKLERLILLRALVVLR
jgi:hypothetical protein